MLSTSVDKGRIALFFVNQTPSTSVFVKLRQKMRRIGEFVRGAIAIQQNNPSSRESKVTYNLATHLQIPKLSALFGAIA